MDKDKLELEIIVGQKATSAYNGFIKDFIEQRRVILFEAFQNLGVSKQDELIEVKRMLYTLEALDTDIKSIMDTGKMASETLNKEEN